MRILARAWLYVIWNCWHNGAAYDPARHRGLQHLLAAQDTGAEQAAETQTPALGNDLDHEGLTQGYSFTRPRPFTRGNSRLSTLVRDSRGRW